MSQMKAKLAVVLKADEVVVAESHDALLWQRVLRAINSGLSEFSEGKARQGGDELNDQNDEQESSDPRDTSSPIGKFAKQLGLSVSAVKGACDPSTAEPYLQLDMHNWSAVKTQLPPRGTSALNPIVVASTLLGLWFRAAGLGNPTQAQAQRVLATISVQDKNPSRGVKAAPWLQPRAGGQVVINAAQVERAILLAKCFCAKDWKPWKTALAET